MRPLASFERFCRFSSCASASVTLLPREIGGAEYRVIGTTVAASAGKFFSSAAREGGFLLSFCGSMNVLAVTNSSIVGAVILVEEEGVAKRRSFIGRLERLYLKSWPCSRSRVCLAGIIDISLGQYSQASASRNCNAGPSQQPSMKHSRACCCTPKPPCFFLHVDAMGAQHRVLI
jgi:hypothetical protein